MPTFRLDRHQHAVGHGFFHTASVTSLDSRQSEQPFRYVYDCGAKKRSGLLAPAIESYGDVTGDEPIDLLVLSHFHADHVNGLESLLVRRKVRLATIPYLPAEERLLLVAQLLTKAHSGFSELRMAADPEAWLLERGVAGVVAVRPGNEAQRDARRNRPRDSDVQRGVVPSPWSLHWGEATGPIVAPATEVTDEVPMVLALGDAVFQFDFFCWHAKNQAKRFARAWIKEGPPTVPDLFDSENELADRLRETDFRARLVRCYRDVAAKGLNWSSLCLLAAPPQPATVFLQELPPYWRTPHLGNAGWLGTGDLEMRDPVVWKAFLGRYEGLGPVHTISLPHHGSIKNFNPGLLRLRPAVVFATCPTGSAKHPHPGLHSRVTQAGARFRKVDESERSALHETVLFATESSS